MTQNPVANPVAFHHNQTTVGFRFPPSPFCLLLLIATTSLLPAPLALAALPAQMTMEALVGGQHVEGTPLAWSSDKVFLLERDGAAINFAPGNAQQFQKTSPTFVPYSPGILKGMLEREFGPKYEVTGTTHFLVVHPVGQRQWADRFEEMYRDSIMYFSVRGFKLDNPEFPLVAIVFPTQDDFRHYAAKDTVPATAGLLGYYSPHTNRVALFDIGDGKTNNAQWQQNFCHRLARSLAPNRIQHRHP